MKFQSLKWRAIHLILTSTTVCSLTLFSYLSQSSAQTLDQVVDQVLANGCVGLGIINSTVLGQNLATNCGLNGSQGGSGQATSNGGGGASFQGSAASILNRVLLQRLDETDEEEGQTHQRSTALTISPLGSIVVGLSNNLSVGSPLYASMASNGGSVTSFTSGSMKRWNGVGVFVSGLVESLNREVTTFQDGYKSMIYGFTGGADYRISKKVLTGLLFTYSNTNGDFRGGGNFNTNSYGGLLFASYLPNDRTFVQVTGGYTRNKYLVGRVATVNNVFVNPLSGLAASNSNGNVFSLGVLTGYDQPIGRFTIGPRVGITYTNTQIADYTETGRTGIELKYSDQWIHSLQSIVGVQATAAFGTRFGVLVPQFNADYIHEFANSQRLITVQFAEDFRDNPTKFQFKNDVPVRNYFNLGTGLVMVWPNGWQSFVNFRAMVGNEQFNNYAGTFGLRIAL